MTEHHGDGERRTRPAGLEHFDEESWESGPAPSGPELPPRRSRARGILLGAAAGLAVVALAILGLWYVGGDDTSGPEAGAPAEAEPAPPPSEPAELTTLPPLDDSDELIRRLLSVLSDHPDVLAWLLGDDLIRHVVVAVDNVADGVSPRRALRGLAPSGVFQATGAGEELRVHPASYNRYDAVAAAIAGADIPGLVGVIRTVLPLLETAYAELGRHDRSFAEALYIALDRLTAVPVPEEPILLVSRTLRHEFRDPRLEALDPVSKQLIRFGPDNQRLVQETLARLASDLRARLPRS